MANAARGIDDERAPAPFLKWVGGKRQLLREILQRLPERCDGLYTEPFIGGGAVFFEMARQGRIRRALLCDTNADLIGTYLAVRNEVEAVIEALCCHRNDESHYYRVRAQDPAKLSTAQRAARLIFMNRCGYNGLYRVNASGGYNVPFGRYANPTICDESGLHASSRALQLAELRVTDFEPAVAKARRGDVAYFDPPYVPVSATASFTSYTRDGFTLEDQRRLRDLALMLRGKGVHVLLSNSSARAVYELYSDEFHLKEVAASRMINCQASGRGKISELLMW